MRSVPPSRQRELCRRLAEYAVIYPDNNFLDEKHAQAESGLAFTVPQADAIEEALDRWKRRLNGPTFDPDRCPPSYVSEIWFLAGHFRDTAEAHGLPVQGRKLIYAELARVIRRDKLTWNSPPGGMNPANPAGSACSPK